MRHNDLIDQNMPPSNFVLCFARFCSVNIYALQSVKKFLTRFWNFI